MKPCQYCNDLTSSMNAVCVDCEQVHFSKLKTFMETRSSLKTIKFAIDGPPVAWHRSGYNRHTGMIFKNKADVVWQNHVRTFAILNRPRVLPEGPIILTCIFRMPRPKYHKPGVEYPHTKKPDLDNLVKSIKDAMNKSMYKDDAQIVQELLIKRFDDKPGVDIQLDYLPEIGK